MSKISFVFYKSDCMGCHACEIACKQEHGLGVGPQLVRVVEKPSEFIPVYCHHCTRPPCRDACPVEAISRNDQGVVLIDPERCIGCRECVQACPFGAMSFDDRAETAVKCDLCLDRLKEGKQTACVSVCPTGCIRFSDRQSIAAVFEKPVRSDG